MKLRYPLIIVFALAIGYAMADTHNKKQQALEQYINAEILQMEESKHDDLTALLQMEADKQVILLEQQYEKMANRQKVRGDAEAGKRK